MANFTVSIRFDIDKLPTVEVDEGKLQSWLEGRLNDARNTFVRHVSRGGGPSSPGEYPATDSGRLVSSTDYQIESSRHGSLGAAVEYAGYLMHGTRKMAKRQMFPEALDETLGSRPQLEELAAAVTFK
jgi:hypothetical protein